MSSSHGSVRLTGEMSSWLFTGADSLSRDPECRGSKNTVSDKRLELIAHKTEQSVMVSSSRDRS